MIKKIMILVSVLTVIITGGWYLFLREPLVKISEKKSVPTKSDIRAETNPNEHSFYDTDFAKQMVIHNQQGMLMENLVANRSSNQELIKIALKIRQEQEFSTNQYIGWLDGWNEEYSDLADFPEMDGHDMYPTHPGMAAANQVARLRRLSGAEFDKLFLKLAIEHHEGAIAMAQDAIGQRIIYGNMVKLRDSAVEDYIQDLKTLKRLQNGGEE